AAAAARRPSISNARSARTRCSPKGRSRRFTARRIRCLIESAIGAGKQAHGFLAHVAGDRESVPGEAFGGGEITVADCDFLPVAAPVSGVADASRAADGDPERNRFEADLLPPKSQVEVVIRHDAQRTVEATMRCEKRA